MHRGITNREEGRVTSPIVKSSWLIKLPNVSPRILSFNLHNDSFTTKRDKI